MKKLIMFFSCLLSILGLEASTKVPVVDHIEPAFWFTGMKQTEVQLMVYGPNISASNVELGNYPGVILKNVVQLDSPNYLLIYLDVAPTAKAGNLSLTFSKGKKKKVVSYELRDREMAGDKHYGFDASDVLYMLMPDRFADGKPERDVVKTMNSYVVDRNEPSLRHGGDIAGLMQHLDYFEELGVTALWFTPLLENNSPDRDKFSIYHGYATTDYYNVDPRFGTNEEYRALTDACHKRGLKVVMDMIFNHCGFEHPWVKDQPSKDWFNTNEWLKSEDPLGTTATNGFLQTSYKLTPIVDPYASDVDKFETTDGWFVPTMPDLNQKNPHVMRYLIQNSKFWIETIGIDGIRMDTYPYADRKAMADWMAELNEEYPNFNVVGETWVTEPAYTAAWQKDSPNAKVNSNLKTVMDFSFYDKINIAATEETDAWWGGLNRIYNSFVYDYLYVDPLHVMAFIDNHDTDRFLKNGQNVPMLKQALTLLLTTRRIPQLYYGTEILMNGTKEVTDGNVRKDFPGGWAGDTHNCFTAAGRTAEENDMFDWTKSLLQWRKTSDVIAKGDMVHFTPINGCYVLARKYEGKTVLVILNGTDKATELPMNRYAEVIGDVKTAKDVTSGKVVSLEGNLKLEPRESLVLPY
ncbi:MAG: glycoside hydrolase family 13 protein [Bacteroidaceae bacterium]|nr:glycoside hydrolase family 13 protein [Bacteroidaceae bacterium]